MFNKIAVSKIDLVRRTLNLLIDYFKVISVHFLSA